MTKPTGSRAARKLLMETLSQHAAKWGDEDLEARARLALGEGRTPRSPDAVFVAVEQAKVLGTGGMPVEGRLYRQHPDGSLTPLDGPGLTLMYERYPEFVSHWRLRED